jgi:hypothetical protein
LIQLLIKIQIPLINRVLLLFNGFKLIRVNIVSIFPVLYLFHNKQKPIIKKISLNLLNVKALKLQPKVVILNLQKLMSKNEVKPISSQPIISVKKLLLITKKIMENINQLINKINSSPLSSYLK